MVRTGKRFRRAGGCGEFPALGREFHPGGVSILSSFTRRLITRRSALGAGLAGAAALVVGTPGTAAAEAAPSPADENLLLHITGTIAVLPVPFPAFGEPEPAGGRVTAARLREAWYRLPEAGRAEVLDGLRAVRPVVTVADDHETVVRRFGEQVTADRTGGLAAVVALGVATLAPRFDPASRSGAGLWLDYARRFAVRMSAAAPGGG